MMNLNETDALAIDMLLGGTAGFPVAPAAARAAGGLGLNSTSIADFMQSAGASGAVSDMNDELSSRVSHVDEILRLLDYLPAEEPPQTLMERTLQRVNESSQQPNIAPQSAQLNAPPLSRPSAGFSPGINRSPAGGDSDPATA